jgi:hypothetical protein
MRQPDASVGLGVICRRAPALRRVQPGPDGERARHRVVGEVAAAGDHTGDARSPRGLQTCGRVLDGQRLARLDAEPLERQQIGLRIGLLERRVLGAAQRRDAPAPAVAQL